MGKLIELISDYADANGGIKKARTVATDEIISKMRQDDSGDIVPVSPKKVLPGSMFFLMCNLSSTKASLLEKLVPMVCVDRKKINGVDTIYGIALSFMPTIVRSKFFDITLPNPDAYIKLAEGPSDKEEPMVPTDFEGAYEALYKIGFEYAIRDISAADVDKAFAVSARLLPQMMILDTYRFTGVDEGKLKDIWKAKIDKQEERRRKIVREMLDGFTNMGKEFNEAIEGVINKSDAAIKALSKLKLSSE